MRKWLLLFSCLLVLAGCVQKEPISENDLSKQGLQVSINSNVKEVKAFEPIKIFAKVTNAGTPVEKTEEIKFEIIKKEGPTIGSVNPENLGKGKYQIETIFDEPGVYQIISHVTVTGAHEMPKLEITVVP